MRLVCKLYIDGMSGVKAMSWFTLTNDYENNNTARVERITHIILLRYTGNDQQEI